MKKEQLGRLGAWIQTFTHPISEVTNLAQDIESWGYGTLWAPDAATRDQFVDLAAIAGATNKMNIATGIATIYSRDPLTMVGCADALNEISNGRFLLGLGVSHREVVSDIREHDYGKPLASMRNYLNQMNTAAAKVAALLGQSTEDKSGMVVLAALQDKMIQLGGEKADGVHPFYVTPEHTAHARELLGPEPLLAPEQHVLLIKDASEARPIARQHMAAHLGLINYRNYLKRHGYTEADFEHGGSDRLVDAIVAWGDESAIMKRVEEHWAAGADHVCIQPLKPEGGLGTDRKTLEALAPH